MTEFIIFTAIYIAFLNTFHIAKALLTFILWLDPKIVIAANLKFNVGTDVVILDPETRNMKYIMVRCHIDQTPE